MRRIAASKNQRGSSLLITLIAIGVVSVLALAYVDIHLAMKKSQARVDFLNTVTQIQMNVASTVNDTNSWAATVGDTTHNTSMACLATNSCVMPVLNSQFVIWPASASSYSNLGLAVYDGTSPNAGFQINGQPCSTFSLSGNDSCPLHLDLSWSTPGCVPAPCSASVNVSANLLYRPSTAGLIGSMNEALLTLSFQQQATQAAGIACSGSIPASEAALCASPPYSTYRLICTSTGFRCGQVYY